MGYKFSHRRGNDNGSRHRAGPQHSPHPRITLARGGPQFTGTLEVALLRRLPIDAGARHAITTTVQYVIVGAGVIVVFDIAGLAWGDIQWLVAALSVGLGFGLQEIVANFISGLIILFERPIRLGDTVTVGEFSGTVTRIRIRATTLVDWDNKEVVVPNKTLSPNVWPTDAHGLSDPVVIPVGIGYGSDTELAHKIMLDLAITKRGS